MLPKTTVIKQLPIYTPQKWQTVILRNYGLVSVEKIAEILNTDTQTIEREAERMGIEKIKYYPDWLERGYITVIRNNWHLLPYEQLIKLLDYDKEKLDFILKEDDFLSVKLGNFKPYAEEVEYRPLTEEEKIETENLREIIKRYFIDNYTAPFSFGFDDENMRTNTENNAEKDRIVYGYSMLYGDALFNGDEIVSDGYLKKLAEVGVNGIWMQGVLSKLSFYPFCESLSEGYEIRRANLNKLIDKCKKFGIGVFLYLNEPRGLSKNSINAQNEKLLGKEYEGEYTLCTSKKEVKEYLYEAVADLVKNVPELKGIITITMSENLTNCYTRNDCTCPVCAKRSRQEIVAEINNIFSRAISETGGKTRVICNLWGWAEYCGWTEKDVMEGISLLDKDVEVLSVSEFGNVINDGKKTLVNEYSISRVGPCIETIDHLNYAKKLGHKTLAKIQANNSWEFACAPYIPVFDLILEHIENLRKLDLSGLMMSWTLGGYPSATLDMISETGKGIGYADWLKKNYGADAGRVEEAVKYFSNGFRSYPFDGSTIYNAAQQVGASNPIYRKKTGLSATMVCFPYDDIDAWRGGRSEKQFISDLTDLTDAFKKGLEIIEVPENTLESPKTAEIRDMAQAVYLNMKSMLVQFEYNRKRETASTDELCSYLSEELELTKRLYSLAARDARIGYEASNHYYFTQNTFLEKFLNLYYLLKPSCKGF